MNGIRNAIHTIFTKENDFKAEWNAKSGFYIFGVDVMFDKTTPIIIEINKNPTLKRANFIVEPLLSIILNQEEDQLFTRII
jgi:glutathione synthase/RimK-type ligase-like ATP-grasp enzyme